MTLQFFKAQKQLKCLTVTGTSKVSKENSYCNQVTCKISIKAIFREDLQPHGMIYKPIKMTQMHTKSSEGTVFSPTRQKSLLVPLSNFIIHLAAGEQLLNNEWPLVMECISFTLKGHKNRSDTTDHREQSLLFHGSSGGGVLKTLPYCAKTLFSHSDGKEGYAVYAADLMGQLQFANEAFLLSLNFCKCEDICPNFTTNYLNESKLKSP